MNSVTKVEKVLEPVASAMGFRLVRVILSGDTRPKLQVMAERKEGGMSIDDCAALSRELSMVLDVDDPISGEYVLEVSSPGIDRPLVLAEDFVRFHGFEARVEMDMPIDGQRRFKGRIEDANADKVSLNLDGNIVSLPLANVRRAKLVLSDELVKAAQTGSLPPPDTGGALEAQ